MLLQAAVPPEGAEDAIPVDEVVDTGAALESTGFLDLLLGTSPLAAVVLLVLVIFSVFSWTIAFSKWKALNKTRTNDVRFQKAFRRISELREMSVAADQFRPSSLVTVFEHGYEEVARQVNGMGRIRNPPALERTLQLGINEELAHLQKNMSWLATTASATPFIGLFGTVWGVLEAFRGLGDAGGATLRAVAPGIAEALIATAMGLFAAIPALIFFNYFSGRIREVRSRMGDFSLEFYNLADQNYGENDGLFQSKRAG